MDRDRDRDRCAGRGELLEDSGEGTGRDDPAPELGGDPQAEIPLVRQLPEQFGRDPILPVDLHGPRPYHPCGERADARALLLEGRRARLSHGPRSTTHS